MAKPSRADFSVSTLSKAVALACLSIISTPVLADSCIGTSTTISSTTTDPCLLGNGESVAVTDTGGVTASGGSIIAVNATYASAGSVTNDGIVTGSGSSGYGVVIQYSSLSGGISNSGTISGSGYMFNGFGVSLYDSTLSGGISNSATISGSSSSTTGFGVYQYRGTLSGGVSNSGTISGSGASSGQGLSAYEATLSGGISNSGTISGTGGNFGNGIVLSNNTFTGDINNSGTISGTGTSFSGNGMNISSGSFTGNINNSGTISGSGLYYGAGIAFSNTITGDINNSGTISGTGTSTSSTSYGLTVSGTLDGTLSNSGTISASSGSVATGIFLTGGVTGGVSNSGALSGTATGPFSTGYGLRLFGTIDGGLGNSGTISGSGTSNGYGIELYDGTISGGLSNSGTISGNKYGIYAWGTAGSSIDSINNEATGIISGGVGAVYLATGSTAVINNSGLIDGVVTLSDNTLNLNGTSGRISGVVSGTSGSTVNVNGSFTSEANFLGISSVNINNGGRLNLHNGAYFTTTSLGNAGTLAVADGVTATIAGDYTQAAGGVFETGASSASSYGVLNVTGTADLTASGAINVNVSANDTLAQGDVLSGVLVATTLNTGVLSVTDNSALWNFTAVQNGNAIDISTQRALTVVDAVTHQRKPAALGVATVLDAFIGGAPAPTGDMTTVINTLNTLGDETGVANAAEQLMPFGSDVALTTLNHLMGEGGAQQVVQHHLSGLASGDVAPDRYLWLQPFGSWTEQDKRGGVSGYDGNTAGIVIGTDARIANDWRLGGALSYARADIDDNSATLNESLDIDSYQATVYASGKVLGDKTLNLQASLATNDNETRRVINFAGMNREAKADFDSWSTQLSAELAYAPVSLGANTSLTPLVGVDYSYVSVDGYTEKGAGAANLRVEEDSEDSLVVSAGGRLQHQLDNDSAVSAHLEVGHDFMADRASVTTTFTGGGASFRTEGIKPASTVVRAGLGYELQTNSNLEITARYDIEARNDFDNQVLSVKLRWPF